MCLIKCQTDTDRFVEDEEDETEEQKKKRSITHRVQLIVERVTGFEMAPSDFPQT